ncbi:DUF6685 family protein [uncultured Salinisphaera sp.]|uniref:DUF6685 family protein n=1 Tax=uncultured Salinisphaera sp. TaxID=359372 RepID=UPI0032B22034|tara:strand:+ start:2933 stop:3976 length:1044 start_codon:yes stop_codon:yes gene_type:complete
MSELIGNKTWAGYWRSIRDEAWLSFHDWLGTPARLTAWTEHFPADDVPAISVASSGIDETLVAPWHRFGQWPVFMFPRREDGLLTGWARDSFGDYRGHRRTCQPLLDFASTTKRQVAIDIRDIDGLSCSKGPLEKYDCLTDFVRHECKKELGEADETAFYRALAHDEIRIIHCENPADHLSSYAWDGRVFLSNVGGSHHFAVAQYLSRSFDLPVIIEAEIHQTSLNSFAIEALSDEFDIFAAHAEANSECVFIDAMRPFGAAFYWIPLPDRFGPASAIFLPRSDQRARRAADVLRDAGFTDLCALLLDIAKKQQTVGDRVIELGADAVPGRINEALRNRISEQLAQL